MDESKTEIKHERLRALLQALDEGVFLVNLNGEVLCALQARYHRATGDLIAFEAVIEKSTVCLALSGKRRPGSEERTAELENLTDREREVLELICEGQDDTAMAATLQLSPNTIRNHIAALYRKIGVNRRSGAVIWARERGIVCLSGAPGRPRTAPRRTNGSSSHAAE